MTYGIIGAMDTEIQMIREQMDYCRNNSLYGLTFYEGRIGSHDVILAKCGIGKVNAARCAQILIDRSQPDYLINTGVAGWERASPGLYHQKGKEADEASGLACDTVPRFEAYGGFFIGSCGQPPTVTAIHGTRGHKYNIRDLCPLHGQGKTGNVGSNERYFRRSRDFSLILFLLLVPPRL